MKKILFVFIFLFTSNLLAIDICVLTTKEGDPYLTEKQDCTHISGGAAKVGTKLTADHLLVLYNLGFSLVSTANITGSSASTMMVYILKRD